MGTNYFSTNINFTALTNLVLRELKEPEGSGSEAVSPQLAEDTLNMVYAEAFNDQRMKQSARESDVSFVVANDTTLVNNQNIGDTSLVISDSSTFLPAGRVLMYSAMADYTSNNLTGTLSGVTPLTVPQTSGAIVRQMYPLSTLAPNIDVEQIQYLNINGIPQTFMEYPTNITAIYFYPNSYSIYKGFLIFSGQSTIGGTSAPSIALMIYTQKVVPMVLTTDTPALIPNEWRIPILVYGACMKIAASDSFRTSWDYWQSEYNKALSQYIAFRNTRVKDIQNKRRPTVWNNYSFFKI